MNASTATLAKQQAHLLQALLGPWHAQALAHDAAFSTEHQVRGLQAYRSNAHSMAERSLQAVYPVTAQLLGDRNFAALARAHWHAQPPVRGDLGQWGVQWPEFLAQHPQLQDEDFLPDVARVEWLLHLCASAADRSLDGPSFEQLALQDPDHLRVSLAPGCALLTSHWPVVSIIQAHQSHAPDLGQLRERMHPGQSETALVWRQGFKPMLRTADAQETAWLHALLQSLPLPDALQAAPGLDFNHWLTQAVQSGLVVGIHSTHS
jgi:hypothetical protein